MRPERRSLLGSSALLLRDACVITNRKENFEDRNGHVGVVAKQQHQLCARKSQSTVSIAKDCRPMIALKDSIIAFIVMSDSTSRERLTTLQKETVSNPPVRLMTQGGRSELGQHHHGWDNHVSTVWHHHQPIHKHFSSGNHLMEA